MRGYSFLSQWTATLQVLTEETIKSSAIEGVVLDPEKVRSSLARRLGLEAAGQIELSVDDCGVAGFALFNLES
jgi:hypothetical protein